MRADVSVKVGWGELPSAQLSQAAIWEALEEPGGGAWVMGITLKNRAVPSCRGE